VKLKGVRKTGGKFDTRSETQCFQNFEQNWEKGFPNRQTCGFLEYEKADGGKHILKI
jgi:hypothetical protein